MRRFHTSIIAVFCTLAVISTAAVEAQQPGATTVQLPTFNFFTISTTVLVPDSGVGFMGGVGRGASGSRSNGVPGLPSSRSGGNGIDAGGVTITAQIHDLRAMDRALLGVRTNSPEAASFDLWQQRVAQAKQSTAGRPTISVAEARRIADAH